MSTVSDQPAGAASGFPLPGMDDQRAVVAAAPADSAAQASAQWQTVADLLDTLVNDYEEGLAGPADRGAGPAAGQELQAVLDAFDVVGSAARINAEVLDDLATEITLAQARMTAIWNEYHEERDHPSDVATGLVERRYATRSGREVWGPLDDELAGGATRLRVVSAGPTRQPGDRAAVIPLSRR